MSIIDHTQPMSMVDTHLAASFPAGFLWGAATAAYQIEGATREDGRNPSIWDAFAATPGKTYLGETGEIAADHYHRMPEDVALMAELGLGAYRFSISWSRVLPDGTGTVNARGLDFYDRLVDELLAKGITPLATLYHWDLPLALHDQGGWLKRDTALAFADYAELMGRRLGDRVDWWLTQNEPWCAAFLGYGNGVHAPGIKDMQAAAVAGHHLLLSHGLAMPRLRAHTRPSAKLGITLNFSPVYAADNRPETLAGVEKEDIFQNRWFVEPIFRGSYPEHLFTNMGVQHPPVKDGDLALISTPLDFLGVNNYSRVLLRSGPEANGSSSTGTYEHVVPVPGACYTEMGWEVYPRGLADLLCRLHRDYAPPALVVTENGAAFEDVWDGNTRVSDPRRVEYLQEHIRAVAQAISQGAPVRGYFAWSLMDNYEWAEGYSKRFGLIYIDYASQRRVIKDSGYWYANFLTSQRGQGQK